MDNLDPSQEVSSHNDDLLHRLQTSPNEPESPWQNERELESGRVSENPEYLMGHPRSVDLREGQGDFEPDPLSSERMWDQEVLALEKQLAEKLEKSEHSREALEVLKLKKQRRKHYIDTLAAQFRSLQGLKTARLEEVESSQKQVELKKRETAHVRLEITRAKNLSQQLMDRCNNDQAMLSRLKKEIKDMQTETELDRELMGACLTYAEKHQAEYNLLKQYCQEDEAKKKECMYRIGRIALEEEEAVRELNALEVELKGTRLEVSRIMESCGQVTGERNAKLENWDKIKSRMAAADADIQRLHGDLDSLGAKRTAKEEAMRRQQEFHEAEARNNDEARKKMELTELNAIKARDYTGEMEKKKQELIDQIHVLDNGCSAKQREVRLVQTEITNLRKQTRFVKNDIQRWKELASTAEAKRKQVNQKNLTDEERLGELNKTLDQRDLLVRAAEQNLVKARDLNYKKTQQNLELRSQLDALKVNIQGNEMYLASLHRQLKQNRYLAHNQAQQMYELQYKITQLNRRISFMEGTDTSPNEKALEDIRKLSVKRDGVQKEATSMRQRLIRQEEMIKNLKKAVDQQEALKKQNETALAEVMLLLHTTQRSLDVAKTRKTDAATEMSSSRLKLRYIADKAESKLGTVTSLSIRQVELGGLFKERTSLIQMEREQYRGQTKRVDEQRSWLTKMLRELENHQRGVKTRYETLTMPVHLDDKEQDATHDIVQIQAAFFVKAARDRQAINNQKLQLQQSIQKVMQDNFRLRQFNENFEKQTGLMKTSLQKVKQTSEIHQKQQTLDDEIAFLKERLRNHETHVYAYQEEIAVLRGAKEKMAQLGQQIDQSINQDRQESRNLKEEVEDQGKRLARTMSQNQAMLGAIKKSRGPDIVAQIQADIEVNVLTDVERLLFSTISRFLNGRPDTIEMVSQLFQQMAIQMSEELAKLLLQRNSRTAGSVVAS